MQTSSGLRREASRRRPAEVKLLGKRADSSLPTAPRYRPAPSGQKRLSCWSSVLSCLEWSPKAVNNKDRNFTRASLSKFIELADAKLDDYLQRLDQSDAAESKTGGSRVANLAENIAAIRARRTRCQDMLTQLERTGEDQISLTAPDSRAMAAHTRVAVGYNVQVAVDTKHKLIVEQQVINQVVDMGLLTQTAEPAKEILGIETIDAVADKGYFKIEDIEACENAGIVAYVPRPQRGPSVRAGLFRKDEFGYDADSDSYVCPAGQRLYPYSSSLLRGPEEGQLRQQTGLR